MDSSRRVLSNPWNPRTFKDCDQQREVPLHVEGDEVLGVLRGEDVQQDPAPHQVMKTNLTEVFEESKQMLVDNASGELEDILNPRLLCLQEPTLTWKFYTIHTPGWVNLGVGTLSMKEDNIVVVTEFVDVDTVVEAETAACSLKVNGDIGDNHRGVAPDTMKQL